MSWRNAREAQSTGANMEPLRNINPILLRARQMHGEGGDSSSSGPSEPQPSSYDYQRSSSSSSYDQSRPPARTFSAVPPPPQQQQQYQSYQSNQYSYQPPPPPVAAAAAPAAIEYGPDGEPIKKRRKRWGDESDKTEALVTVLPSTMTSQQQQSYLLHVQIEAIQARLVRPDLGIPADPAMRSPSPPPMYSSDGKRLNTREVRTRAKLEENRHKLITDAIAINPEYRPPADYKPPKKEIKDTIWIPQEQFPDVNFIGLLIGPRGNTLRKIESDTGGKIMIRGKGSVKEGKNNRNNPDADLPLHAVVMAPTMEALRACVKKVEDVIKLGTEVPDQHNELKRLQLRELASLNGTLRDDEHLTRCNNCGSTAHRSWQCTEQKTFTNTAKCEVCGGVGHIARDCRDRGNPNAAAAAAPVDHEVIDTEYTALMAELEGKKKPAAASATTAASAAGQPPAPGAPVDPSAWASAAGALPQPWAAAAANPWAPPPPAGAPWSYAAAPWDPAQAAAAAAYGYAAAPQGYGAMPQGYGMPPAQGYGAPAQGYGAYGPAPTT